MRFILASADLAARALSDCLIESLRNGAEVVWLVSGGSNIPITTQVMETIPDELTKHLTVMLADERYGIIGHTESNAQQLLDSGFSQKRSTFMPVLNSTPFADTVHSYNRSFERIVKRHPTFIAQLGIGTDGHIAGILPHSPAVTETKQFVIGFEGPDYTRITITPAVLQLVSIAYALVYGDSKHDALERLENSSVPSNEQPAQILKAIPQAYVYNDQVS